MGQIDQSQYKYLLDFAKKIIPNEYEIPEHPDSEPEGEPESESDTETGNITGTLTEGTRKRRENRKKELEGMKGRKFNPDIGEVVGTTTHEAVGTEKEIPLRPVSNKKSKSKK